MKNRTILALLFAGLFAASSAMAGDSLLIRLVEASNSGTGAAGLSDVIDVLKNSVPGYGQFSLVASGSTALPADGGTVVVGKYKISCKGSQKDLKIEVSTGHKRLLSMSASLRDGIPVILGGFPSDKGKHILVFLAQ